MTLLNGTPDTVAEWLSRHPVPPLSVRPSNLVHRMTRMIFRKVAITGSVILALIVIPAGIIAWTHFHPRNATPVIGPQGSGNRAFIENRSFGDLSFVLCASDWPHTFTMPASLGSVMYSEGSDARIFWSADGSVLAVRNGAGPSSWQFTTAYDYDHHEAIQYDSARITALIASRGGLGPEQGQYPDGKDDY